MKQHSSILVLIACVVAILAGTPPSYAQDLLSAPSVFVFKRPIAKGGGGKAVTPKGSATNNRAYKSKGQRPKRSSRDLPNTAVAATSNAGVKRIRPTSPSVEQIGITLWKLRPEVTGETGARLLTMGKQSKDPQKLIAERVELETRFAKGDKVRLSVESPRTGYMYIVDREIRKDGSLGDPYLIFPTLRTRGGDNRVGIGKVIEVPAQTDDPFYYEIEPTEANYAGEMLTVLISPTKIVGLTLSGEPIKLAPELVAEWERKWDSPSTLLELDGGTGQKYTEEEKDAGTGKRQLTHKSPSPQSVLLVETPKTSAFMVSFPLLVAR